MGSYGERLISLIYPRRCPVCDNVVPKIGTYICPECTEKLNYIKEPVCQKCGKELDGFETEYCRDCREDTHAYTKGAALYSYPCVRQSIYRIKYEGRREYLDFYADEIVRRLGSQIRLWEPDGIIGVPLFKKRQQKRGYNQAEILAKRIGKQMKIPVYTDLVKRCRNTVPQKGLDVAQRQNNLKKAFIIGENVVKLNTIIIIDDIYTTGSTIDAIARLLLGTGVQKVYYIVLAIGE